MRAGLLSFRTVLWLGAVAATAVGVAIALQGQTAALDFLAFPAVGALLLHSQPRNGVGWFLYAAGLYMGAIGPLQPAGGASWLSAEAESVIVASGSLFWMSLPLIGLLFPSGRIATRLGRLICWIDLGLAVVISGLSLVNPGAELPSGRPNPFGAAALQPVVDIAFGPVFVPCFLLIIAAVFVDIVRRYRRGDAVLRLQYRWLVFALAVLFGSMAVYALTQLWWSGAMPPVFATAWGVVVNLIPIAIWIAVTRHGLYSIGRVVSRTIAYAIVVIVLIAGYAGIVVGLTTLIPGLPSIGVAVATLAAAALFLPLLRWVQHWVDRRFDRERYDAEHVVEAFGERLQNAVDPDTTVPELVRAVEQTLRPGSIGVWTR